MNEYDILGDYEGVELNGEDKKDTQTNAMVQAHNQSHHTHELQLIACITKWQEHHITILKKDVPTLEGLFSSLSKAKDDVVTELQRISDQVRDCKRLFVGVDGELIQLQGSMETLNLKKLDLRSQREDMTHTCGSKESSTKLGCSWPYV
jgi:hypothetical protein